MFLGGKGRIRRRSIIVLTFMILGCSSLASDNIYIDNASASEQDPALLGAETTISSINPEPYYYEVSQQLTKQPLNIVQEVDLPAERFMRKSDDVAAAVGPYRGESDVLVWSNPKGWVEYRVEVDQEGDYALSAEYSPFSSADGGGRESIIMAVQVNGTYPFREAHSISFERDFKEVLPIKYDAEGNQIRSQIEEITNWKSKPFRDSEGAYAEPLLWHLNKGSNVIRLQLLRQPIALKKLTVSSPAAIPSYDEVKAGYHVDDGAQGKVIMLEGEQFASKNTTSIQSQYDRDPKTTPKTYNHVVFNTLGGSSWNKGGQAVSWEFEVPEDGLYKLGLRVKQNFRKNLSIYRSIYIDGKIPFSELFRYKFEYRSGWHGKVIGDEENNPFLFELKKGKHTLTMEATYEPYMPVLSAIDRMSSEIKDISLQIKTATGNREDRYRVWHVEQDIPGVVDRLKALREQFNALHDKMVEINGKTDNVSQSFKSSVSDINSLLKNTDEIPYYQLKIGGLQEKLDTQRQDLMESPLQIDKMYIAPKNVSFPRMTAKLGQQISGFFSSLFYSFQNHNQYSQQRADELNVWMMWGRDYVDELQQLVDQKFTPEYGIKVKVNVIQSADLLVLAKSAGILPDVALGIPSGMPFDMALRNAAYNMKELPDADRLFQSYHPGALLPYHYQSGYYGIPETMNFKVLFYRKDVLQQLGLTVPNTWDDVYTMIPTLLQNNMNFYMDGDFSYPFYQNHAELYAPNGLSSALNKPEAFESFKRWTDFYNMYGMEKQVQSFYNQFRRGDMPIGIADFNQYMQLLVAAPEILNDWAIAPIPGTAQADGSVERWAGGLQTTSIMMFKDTPVEKRDLAWKFIQWYTSSDTQTEYGLNLEQYRGETFRWNPANIAAFVKMPWRQDDLNVILEQWKWIKDMPNVPGGYMTGRELGFAWNRTVVDGENPRISLEKAVNQINRELTRKQQEFHIIDKNGKQLKRVDLPQVTEPWGEVDKYVK